MVQRTWLWNLSVSLLFTSGYAQTITITEHVSACSATYTSHKPTTTVQSTVMVMPSAMSDAAINNGLPFVINLQQEDTSGWPMRAPAIPYWLMENGNTTTNASMAAQYYLNNGQLMTVSGKYASTDVGVTSQAFRVSNQVLPINTTFSCTDGMLNWTNAEFSNGTAQFYKLPPGLLDNALILAKFLGPMQPERSWSPIVLRPEPGE